MMIRVMSRGAGNKKLRATKLPEAKLDALIEEATVDAYNESEQMMGFHAMLDEHLDMPFKTEVLGVEVTVEKVDLTDDDQIVVVCARGKSRQTIPILDLPLPSHRRKGRNGSTPIADGRAGDSGGRTYRSRQAPGGASGARRRVHFLHALRRHRANAAGHASQTGRAVPRTGKLAS
jgi:hypothetical protein